MVTRGFTPPKHVAFVILKVYRFYHIDENFNLFMNILTFAK